MLLDLIPASSRIRAGLVQDKDAQLRYFNISSDNQRIWEVRAAKAVFMC